MDSHANTPENSKYRRLPIESCIFMIPCIGDQEKTRIILPHAAFSIFYSMIDIFLDQINHLFCFIIQVSLP
jgi:hypothetical protein